MTSQARLFNTPLFITDTCLQKSQRRRKHENKQVPAKKGAFDRIQLMTRLFKNVTKHKFRTG